MFHNLTFCSKQQCECDFFKNGWLKNLSTSALVRSHPILLIIWVWAPDILEINKTFSFRKENMMEISAFPLGLCPTLD